MTRNANRIIFSALRGSSGKTLLATGVIAALRKQGLNLACFKKGPDFIDAAWLGHAAGHACHHLDSFLMPPEYIRRSFVSHSAPYIRLREYKRMYARILERYHRLSDPTGPEHTPIPVPVSGNISEPKQ